MRAEILTITCHGTSWLGVHSSSQVKFNLKSWKQVFVSPAGWIMLLCLLLLDKYTFDTLPPHCLMALRCVLTENEVHFWMQCACLYSQCKDVGKCNFTLCSDKWVKIIPRFSNTCGGYVASWLNTNIRVDSWYWLYRQNKQGFNKIKSLSWK